MVLLRASILLPYFGNISDITSLLNYFLEFSDQILPVYCYFLEFLSDALISLPVEESPQFDHRCRTAAEAEHSPDHVTDDTSNYTHRVRT